VVTWFKGLVLAVATILGLSQGGAPPPLSLSAYRDASMLYASVEVEQLPGRDLARLVQASYVIRLQAVSWAGGVRAENYRDIQFDGLQYTVFVSETGKSHTTDDDAAAWALASRFGHIPLGLADPARFPLAMGCKVTLSLPGITGYDPMIVWAYRPAAGYRELDSVGMVPYR